jgi:N utilization substance protein A
LASKLTGWHLDVQSETKYSEIMKSGYDSLMALPGVDEAFADLLYKKGFISAEEIGNASVEDLLGVDEEKIDEVFAEKLINEAIAYVESMEEAESEETEPEETGTDEADATEAGGVDSDENESKAASDAVFNETEAVAESGNDATNETAAGDVPDDGKTEGE